MASERNIIKVKCPVCRRSVEWTPEYPFKPFCSERCKLIDLGAWAAEEHRIPEEGHTEEDESRENPRFQ
ncbi:MAG: DNA gyrase inhibitor YacG [Gammaproteobacteria bacterium]